MESPSDIGIIRAVPGASNPWAGDFEMTTLLSIDTSLGSSDDCQFEFYVERTGVEVYVALYLAGASNEPSVLSVFEGSFTYVDSYDLPTTPSTADTPIWLKWRRVSATGQLSAKVWWGSDPEPDWQADLPTTSATGDTTGGLVAQWSSSSSSTRRMSADYIDFCPAGGGATSTSSPTSPFGSSCEEATRLSSTQYEVSTQYVPGTTAVYVDGLRQRPGIAREYTEDSGHTTITFNDPVAVDAVVVICYSVAISPGGSFIGSVAV